MKYIKSYILFVLMVFAVTGCTMDDLKDDVNDLKDRVTLIEQQVKLLNDNLAVIGYILDPQNKTISNVKTQGEGENRQYVITLSNGEQLTLTIGKEGTVNEPEITIGEDGKWYINGNPTGVIAVGENGKNGEGFPEFRVQDGNWQVRFGDGAWANVKGGEGIAGGSSLGDQIFESAEVDGSNFVVTLKDGSVHTLPIVETLVCVIDKTGLTLDAEGFLIVNKDERVVLPVKIEGEKTQVTYPEGWRATLNKLDVADEKGNNYQLLIFAPAAKTRALTRAAADNTADVTVQVQKGSFWAVDKIKVKNPKDYSNNLVKYNDGLAVTVGGFDITNDKYGAATEITSDQSITEGGVYFVSTNNVTLTYDLGTTGVDNLIIIPTTEDITMINLTVSKQVYLKGTFVCQNVNFTSTVNNNVLRLNEADMNVVFDRCTINGLKNTKALMVPNTANTHYLNYCAIVNSDIRIEETEAEVIKGAGIAIINNMDCSQLIFENNIVYAAHTVTGSSGQHLVNFKLISGNSRIIKDELNLNSNTFIDVETTGGSGVTGLVYCKSVKKVTVKNNIYWLTNPTIDFINNNDKPSQSKSTVLLRVVDPMTDAIGSNNYGYNGNTDMKLQMCYSNTRPDTVDELVLETVFDTSDQTTFNKSTGTFIPKVGYTQYGAQR